MSSAMGARLRRCAITAGSCALVRVLRIVARYERRRRRAAVPQRVFLGTTPIISLAVLAQAARERGMQAVTVVREVYSIHEREVFDRVTADFVPRPLRWLPSTARIVLADLLVFVWALHNFDVFFFYVDGRILVRTPLRAHEYDLLHRAGKKVVVTCYGGDVQTLDRVVEPDFRTRLLEDYPDVTIRQEWVGALRDAAERSADVLVAGVEWVDYLNGWTHLISAPYFLDPAAWPVSPVDRRPGSPVVVFHAANHRQIKGTDLLEAAVRSLQARGVPVALDVAAGVPHHEVRARMAGADIVADQFVIGWYGLQAVEAMSLGKPVLAYLRADLQALYSEHSYATECPIVPTPPGSIESVLESLVVDVERRRELGVRGRRFVERYHSVAYAGEVLDQWIAAASLGPQPRCHAPKTTAL